MAKGLIYIHNGVAAKALFSWLAYKDVGILDCDIKSLDIYMDIF